MRDWFVRHAGALAAAVGPGVSVLPSTVAVYRHDRLYFWCRRAAGAARPVRAAVPAGDSPGRPQDGIGRRTGHPSQSEQDANREEEPDNGAEHAPDVIGSREVVVAAAGRIAAADVDFHLDLLQQHAYREQQQD